MRLIFDNDAASDDIIALLYLFAHTHSHFHLEAITITGTGEAHAEQGARNIADLCKAYKKNIPIAYGRAEPLSDHGTFFPDFLRKMTDEILLNKSIPISQEKPIQISNNAVELIKNTILKYPTEKITILATGPLTNIAEFIQSYPNLVSQIEKIVIMGGAVNVAGNIKALLPDTINEVAEWNIYADPLAADIVFRANIPITLVPLDITNQIPMTQAFYDNLSKQRNPTLRLIYELLKDIVDNLGLNCLLTEFYLWDPLAAMIALYPDTAISKSLPIEMDLSTGHTKVSPNGCDHNHIQVALSLKNTKDLLNRFITDIQSNLYLPNHLFSHPQTLPTSDNLTSYSNGYH